MAGHGKLHPYLKSYDELKRTMNRMVVYLDMFKDSISPKEKNEIEEMLKHIDSAILCIPSQYHVSRHNQFKDKE